MFMKFTVFTFVLLTLFSTSVHAQSDSKVRNFIEAMNSSDNDSIKLFYLGYYSATVDIVMDYGMKLGELCFPDPMPNRKEFYEQHLRDIEIFRKDIGEEKTMNMEISQFVGLSWLHHYRCNKKAEE